MNDLFSLAGKNILITGAAQGIGYLLATGLGRYGARIIVNDHPGARRNSRDETSAGRDKGYCRSF